MSRNPSQNPDNAGPCAGTSETERQERINQLTQRRSKLSPDEAALLREVFPDILAAHHKQVWNRLRRRRLSRHEAEEIYQEVFLELYNHILEKGFPKRTRGLLKLIVEWKILTHVAAQNRVPPTEGLPSSGSQKPPSEVPDLDRAMDLHALLQYVLPRLVPEHREVVDQVILQGLSHGDAAEVLGLTEGEVKGRLAAAERAMFALAKRLVPPSQRGPA